MQKFHDGGHGIPKITNKISDWLIKNGWVGDVTK
jgi:hypothetical protein